MLDSDFNTCKYAYIVFVQVYKMTLKVINMFLSYGPIISELFGNSLMNAKFAFE